MAGWAPSATAQGCYPPADPCPASGQDNTTNNTTTNTTTNNTTNTTTNNATTNNTATEPATVNPATSNLPPGWTTPDGSDPLPVGGSTAVVPDGTDGTTVLGTTARNPSGDAGAGILPRTGGDLLRLLLWAMALVLLGTTLVMAARKHGVGHVWLRLRGTGPVHRPILALPPPEVPFVDTSRFVPYRSRVGEQRDSQHASSGTTMTGWDASHLGRDRMAPGSDSLS